MTHDQIVAALRRGYQLDDARESRRGCYPVREPAPRTTARRMWDDPRPPAPPTRPGSAKAASSEAMTGRAQTPGEQAPPRTLSGNCAGTGGFPGIKFRR